MTKAIPSKENAAWIWCQECCCWYLQSDCSQYTMYSTTKTERQFYSHFNSRSYYLENDCHEESVWRCPNDCWIWDENDEDVSTPLTFTGILYTCSDCEARYDDKDDADNCCWKSDN